ncbi:hypothetical protein P4393_11950 [Bacillus subtilis]|nr:hypothetical protein [Bacillus subtilis]MED3474712.1 hypothetical protein [Bacillus subtilis]
MAYTRLDKISATVHIESIVANEDLENGQWLELGDLQPDGEARLATPSGDTSKELVFHSSVPLTYEDQTNELDFVLKAGKVGRGYVPEDGQIISISENGVIGEITKNALVIPDPKGFAVTTEAVTGLHGKIIAIENDVNAGRLAVIRIKK